MGIKDQEFSKITMLLKSNNYFLPNHRAKSLSNFQSFIVFLIWSTIFHSETSIPTLRTDYWPILLIPNQINFSFRFFHQPSSFRSKRGVNPKRLWCNTLWSQDSEVFRQTMMSGLCSTSSGKDPCFCWYREVHCKFWEFRSVLGFWRCWPVQLLISPWFTTVFAFFHLILTWKFVLSPDQVFHTFLIDLCMFERHLYRKCC